MRNFYILALGILITFTTYSQDTFSIIAVDPATGDIGSAGASCVDGAAAFGGIIDIITDIIPGRGGVNSQALVCIPNVNLENAIAQMQGGSSPQEIIDWLLLNDACSAGGFDPQERQYGIADLDPQGDPRTAGFTGSETMSYAEDRQGATYSVQGNILLNQSVIDNMEDNFNNTAGTLADKLMAAMQGANFAGADSRCLARGTSSTSAYLMVYRETDTPGNPYLRLNIEEMPFGEEPIDSLQILYDDFLLSVKDNSIRNKVRLAPNPVSEMLTLSWDPSIFLTSAQIFDVNGKMVMEKSDFTHGGQRSELNVSQLNAGVYFLNIESLQGKATLRFVKD